MALYYQDAEGNWLDAIHPVGCFYISQEKTSPSTLFGGTWTQVTGAAIRGATTTGYTGSDSTTLTNSQLPKLSGYFNLRPFNGTDLYPIYGGDSGIITVSKVTWDGSGHKGFESVTISADPSCNRITTSFGGGSAHTNIQRSYNCYVWYRTA